MTTTEPEVEVEVDVRGRAGRRRSHAADEAILAATLDLVREHGYRGFTMTAVIERAGVSSATLYRRWSTKHDLVVAALEKVRPVTPTSGADSDTGSLAGDIRQFLGQTRTAVAGGWIELAEAIGVEAKRDSDLSAALRERFLEPRTDELAAILRRAEERGELESSVPAEVALSMVVGPLHHHAVLLRKPITDAFLETACAHAICGLQLTARAKRN